jgi:hypothetical protein
MEGNYSCHDGEYVRPCYLNQFHVVQGLARDGESLPVERPLLLIRRKPTAAVGHQKGSYPKSATKQRDFGDNQLEVFHEII